MAVGRDDWHFRTHLEGLRGVAATLVVFFHAGWEAMAGGYLGVDVFFVLSGFLITSLLLRQIGASGTLNLRAFYARRARRLLPPALLVLVVSFLLLVAPANTFYRAEFSWGFAAASGYVSNWYFLHQATDYFAQHQSPSPVLHYWSLAVEEQFYLFWPLAMLALVRWTSARVLALTLAAGALLGALWTLSLSLEQPLRAHFGTDARLYQLLAGAAIAAGMQHAPLLRRPSAGSALCWVGLLAILGLAVLPTGWSPAALGVLTTLATVALILGGEVAGPDIRCRPLTSRPAQLLGKISYASYLWHWPLLLVLERYDGLPPAGSLGRGAILFALTTLAAWLTLVVLEGPIRRAAPLRDRAGQIRAIAVGLGLSALCAGLMLVTAVSSADSAVMTRLNAPAGVVAEAPTNSGRGFEILLYGDSTARMWWPAALELATTNSWDLRLLWGPHCPWFFGEGQWRRRGTEDQYCRRAADAFDTVMTEGRTDVVVVSSHSLMETDLLGEDGRVHPPGSPAWMAKAEAEAIVFLRAARAAGVRVIIIEPIPSLAEAPSECVVGVDDTRCDRRPLPDPTGAALTQLFRSLAQDRPDVDTVDLGEVLCPDGACTYVFDGRLARRDALHINAEFAMAHSTEFAEHLLCRSSDDPPFPDEVVAAARCTEVR